MPSFGAMAVVLSEGKVLLQKRLDSEVWALPAGGIEAGETVSEAAIREVKEETGIDVVLDRLVGIYSSPRWASGGDHTVVFAATPTGGQLRPQDTESIDVGYFDPADLPEPFVWWHRRRIQDAVQGLQGLAVIQDRVFPFDPDISYEEIQALRESAGLTPGQFFQKHQTKVGGRGEEIEVPPPQRRD